MNWYQGGVAEAIAFSQKQNSIFVVYIEGQDEPSKKLTDVIENGNVAKILGGTNFTAVKVEANSVSYQQFSEFYKQVPIPSIYFIGKNGAPLEIIQETTASQLEAKINNILRISGKNATVDSFLSAERTAEVVPNKSTESFPSDNTAELISSPSTDVAVTEEASSSSGSSQLSPEERVARVKELLEQKKEVKRLEEEEVEKSKEMERRKMGQDVQKLKKWQQEQELKNIMEAREKERQEEKRARQRVLDQIKQDKADRASRFGGTPVTAPPQPEQPPKPAKTTPKSPPNNARLQFKLPDGGSQTRNFQSSATLMEVRNFVSELISSPVNGFALSTTFPRREFTHVDNNKTMVDLELVPNAVILVLPLSQGAISTGNEGFIYSMLWSFLTPFLSLFQYLKAFVVGAPPRNESNENTGQNKKRPSDNTGESSRMYKKKPADSTVVHRQGNVHRLHDRTDSDDENNTWNGNSTQQM